MTQRPRLDPVSIKHGGGLTRPLWQFYSEPSISLFPKSIRASTTKPKLTNFSPCALNLTSPTDVSACSIWSLALFDVESTGELLPAQIALDNNAMHAKPDLRVFLKWKIARSGSAIADVIRLRKKSSESEIDSLGTRKAIRCRA